MRVLLSRISPPLRRVLLLVLCCASAASDARAATTLAQYREKVRDARAQLEELALLCEGLHERAFSEEASPSGADESGVDESDEVESSPALLLPVTERRVLAAVRNLLPPAEQVERDGATVAVNNAWLHAALDEYEKLSATGPDNGRRAEVVRSVSDRLAALDARLAEAEGAAQQSPAAARDKDAEKGRLANILRGREYNREAAEGGALQRLIEKILDAINDLFPGVRPLRPGAGRRAPVLQYVVFALALAVVFYIVWKYWVRRRDRLKSVTPKEARVVLGERIEADRTASDLLDEAELLAREGDLRGAIRKAYVALLCELGDRKIIRLARHKTNRDYLRDARRDAPPRLYEEMRPLTDGFERHWYGLEEAGQSDWADYRTRCRQALSEL